LPAGHTIITFYAQAKTDVMLYFKNDPKGIWSQKKNLQAGDQRSFSTVTDPNSLVTHALDIVENLGPNAVDYVTS
jgi:hypothetical protein